MNRPCDVPGCGHAAAHAGGHGEPGRPATAYCAPGRCYCGSCGEPEPAPEPAGDRRRERWGRYGQADAELVRDVIAGLRSQLAEINASKWGRRR